MLTTFVPGVARADLAWADARDAFVELLHAFRAIPAVRCDGLAPPRAWCGGPRWPDIVADDLVRHLPVFARERAERVVAELISTEQVGEPAFVHGDVGLHNSLRDWRPAYRPD